jgi:hypothetical protein
MPGHVNQTQHSVGHGDKCTVVFTICTHLQTAYTKLDTCNKSNNVFGITHAAFSRLQCVRHSTTLYLTGTKLYTLLAPLISLSVEVIMPIFVPVFLS